MAVGEAMAVGVPIIVTDTVNYPEVQGCGAGFVVAQNAVAVADGVDRVLANTGLQAEMRRAGERFAVEELSWDRVAERFVTLVREVRG